MPINTNNNIENRIYIFRKHCEKLVLGKQFGNLCSLCYFILFFWDFGKLEKMGGMGWVLVIGSWQQMGMQYNNKIAIQLSSQIYYNPHSNQPQSTLKPPKMFSLSDDIQKFQQSLLQLPDTVITLDQRFLGGGIKMQDLIQQNSFIITEMRKVKSVFLNYCKLNDKVYKKIIEYEVSANEHYNKVLTISNTIDRKLEDSDQELKKTKEMLQMEMKKLREGVENGIKDVKVDLGGKIGEVGFGDRVKKIIEEYEQQNASSSLPQSDGQIRQQSPTSSVDPTNPQSFPASATSKKRRGLTQQDIEHFKSQITPMIDQLSQKLTTQNTYITDLTNTQFSHSLKIKKLQKDCEWYGEDIPSIKKSVDELKIFIKEEDEKIVALLRDTINQNVWTARFEEFRTKVLAPGLQVLSNKFYKTVQDIRKQVDDTIKPKFTQIHQKLAKQSQKQKSLQSTLLTHSSTLSQIPSKLSLLKSQLMSSMSTLQQSLHTITQQTSTTFHNHFSSLTTTQEQMSSNIAALVQTTEQAVLKKVQIKLGKEMKDIRNDIGTLNRKTSQITNNVKFNFQQVDHVKDVVAKKANFTDLIQYYDRKADKQEVRELVQRVESPRGWATVGTVGEEQRGNRRSSEKILHDDRKRRRRSSYSRGGLTTPMYTKQQQPFPKQRDSPQSKQLLKNIIKTNAHMHAQTTTAKIKTKSMRPSTANTLFML